MILINFFVKDADSSDSAKSIPSTQYIDFMIQHKQQLMVDRRRASLSSQHEFGSIGDVGDDKSMSASTRRFSWSRTRSIDADVEIKAINSRQNQQFQQHHQQYHRQASADSEPMSSPPATPSLKNYPVETRRIVKNECYIRRGSVFKYTNIYIKNKKHLITCILLFLKYDKKRYKPWFHANLTTFNAKRKQHG